ncbi:MAG: HNH endonuclease [Paucibacter sp.]|nr:HNH endonuclease [Roseateles sp.]
MKLTKPQREALRMKFGGLCAYCGNPLGDRWHADHFEAVRRNDWGKVPGPPEHPERDRLDNLMPACAPCNIDKHSMKLEDWRGQMERSHDVLHRDNGTYRRMLRYGLVLEARRPIVFHFERSAMRAGA